MPCQMKKLFYKKKNYIQPVHSLRKNYFLIVKNIVKIN